MDAFTDECVARHHFRRRCLQHAAVHYGERGPRPPASSVQRSRSITPASGGDRSGDHARSEDGMARRREANRARMQHKQQVEAFREAEAECRRELREAQRKLLSDFPGPAPWLSVPTA